MALDSSSSNPAALLTALVAPAAIVGLALAWLGRVDPEAAAAADAPEVKACLETMDKGDDVVLVGNSKSGTDIDRPALAKALGVTQIAKLGAPGSSAPLWYAAVERCAYEAGHTPRLVIVYGVAGAAVPLVGGCAGDDLAMQRTEQLHGDRVLHNAVVAANP